MLTGEFGCSSAASFLQSSLSTAISSCYKAAESRVFFSHAASHASRYGPNKTLVALVTGPWCSQPRCFNFPWEDLLIV